MIFKRPEFDPKADMPSAYWFDRCRHEHAVAERAVEALMEIKGMAGFADLDDDWYRATIEALRDIEASGWKQ